MLSPDELNQLSDSNWTLMWREGRQDEFKEKVIAHIREQAEALRKANEALRTAREVIEHYRRGKHEKTFGPAAHWLVTHPAQPTRAK